MLKSDFLKKTIIFTISSILLLSCAEKEEDELIKNTQNTDTQYPYYEDIKINNDDSSTSSKSVKLQLYAEDDTGVTAYYLSQESSYPDDSSSWITISSTTTFTQTVSYDLNTDSCTSSSWCYIYVYVWFKDAAGNISWSDYDYINYSPTPPTNPKISINDGDASTDNTTVNLSISALDDDGIVGYYISQNTTTPSANASGLMSTAICAKGMLQLRRNTSVRSPPQTEPP